MATIDELDDWEDDDRDPDERTRAIVSEEISRAVGFLGFVLLVIFFTSRYC